jgi:ABC-type Zn2+ transport system substrate-binding protein/surface adhesin
MDSEMNNDQGPNITLWLGIAIGAAVGIGIALSRRKRTPWDQARKITTRLSDHSGDLADATSNIMQRVRTIYDEGCKVVEEAGELWSHGRKLVSR